MIRAGVGHSTQSESVDAAVEAAKMAMARLGQKRADLAIVFASASHQPAYPHLLHAIRQVTKTDHLVGCSAYGVMTIDVELELTPAVAVMALASDELRLTPFCFHHLQERNEAVGRAIGRLLRHANGSKPARPKRGAARHSERPVALDPLPVADAAEQTQPLVMLFPDTFSMQPTTLFRGIHHESGPVTIIGGGASEDGTLSQTYQFFGADASPNAVSGVMLEGRFVTTIGLSQACHPVGETMAVTRSKGNVVMELGGRPAFEVFEELIKEHDLEPDQIGAQLFVGLPVDPAHTRLQRGEYLIRNIVGANPRQGSIAVATEVQDGQVLSFTLRQPDETKAAMEEMLQEMAQIHHGRTPAFGLYFDCCGRGSSLYGESGTDLSLIKKYLGEIPLLGFFTYAEIAPLGQLTQLHNYTGVLALVSSAG
ncbi:MAG: FIST N-terminal domain-containing protein [Nitrospirota bacterium]